MAASYDLKIKPSNRSAKITNTTYSAVIKPKVFSLTITHQPSTQFPTSSAN